MAALVFVGNGNAVYLQSTPMTEMLLLACIAATVFHLQRWCRTGRYGALAAASLATLLATLTRYEGWVLCIAACTVVAFTAVRTRRDRFADVEANLIFFGVVALSGIAGWVLWNLVIFGNPLEFQNGDYAKPSLWASAATDPAIGDWGAALRTYLQAMAYDLGAVAMVLAGAGVVVHLARARLRPDAVALYPLLAFFPFFVYALQSGQRPLHVPEVGGLALYNVRFGMVMVLATAVFTGYLVGQAVGLVRSAPPLARSLAPALLAVAAVAACALAVPGIATLDEARAFRASDVERANSRASAWLREHYDGGLVLMESFGNESVTFDSQIPTQSIVYEGSFQRWEPALAHPAGHDIRWVYLRTTPGGEDQTWAELAGTPELENDYALVFDDDDREIYRRRGDDETRPSTLQGEPPE